jgi:hypothetical protein
LNSDDKVFHLTLNDIGDWRPDIYVSRKLYSTNELSKSLVQNLNINLHNSKSQIGTYLAKNNLEGDIYFLSNSSRNNKKLNKYLTKENLSFSTTQISSMLIIKINREDKEKNNFLKFFLDIHKNFQRHSWNVLLMEILTDYYIIKNDTHNAAIMINKIKQLSISNAETIEKSTLNKEKFRNDLVRYYQKSLRENTID